MSTFQEEQLQFAEREAEAQRSIANLKRLRAVYAAYPQIASNMANTQMLEAYCAPDVVNVAAIQFALENGSPLIASLSLLTEAGAREKFVETIIGLTKVPAGEDAGKHAAYLRRQLLAKVGESQFDVQSTAALQTKAQEAQKSVDLRGKSSRELRELVRNSTDANIVGTAVAGENATAKTHLFIDGRMYPTPVPAEITRQAIIKADPAQIKRWLRTYHKNQIDARLFGKG